MRILSIGNSFSHDAHKWLHKLAHDNDENLETVNLFIAACSLKMHWENFQNNSAAYDFQPNGNASEKKN